MNPLLPDLVPSDVLEQAQAGNPTAQMDILSRHHTLIAVKVQRARRRCPWLAADDLFAEAQVVVLKAIRRFHPARGGHFTRYALRSVRGRFHDLIRREQSQSDARIHSDAETNQQLLDEFPTPRPHRLEQMQQIHELLPELPDRERQVIDWHFGVTTGSAQRLEWIGRRMGISRQRAQQLLHRGYRMLRERLDADPLARLV
ncbi:sigma-70 family RNA polymerase sigma factor [Tuwongella immobilis]|uniref:RNA polymerase sigma-70 region 2 domain-containing protein n=1 Tax=Tuwongella immobilis TaxID=692036 RepID=A0A6C2YTM4_9BACT|nr:sigma-70 family RNA polymerase sigma factor [Tuwongella immobilis]VIP04379.1 rna polymerase sigma factor : Sporulation sigma factor SigE OS=human gut metagenome GN=OBE_01930 PE=4 SV=1: Sigma70_r2: Sigma70_r4 [Tuwongella immobilis]VTS06120.1 rna polymerase sigma factor : Sporulation sigma factor SigE OS=human gut metagenome GN=OBE_01930 PE=4 SV=1: Sigma70_r2: Sigma70_r4 [Tuwongella immobilis]